MACFLIGLGSNAGNRLSELIMAREWLRLHGTILSAAPMYETEPVGPGTADYLNTVLALETTLPPEQLLIAAKRWERDRGRRQPVIKWTDRPVDIDLLHWSEGAFQKPGLQLPHPEMHRRRFVLEPLQHIRPGWTHPLLKTGVAELIDAAPEIRMRIATLKW